MGYHGFGMRKEAYKRKPKQAFDKIKKHNKKNPYAAPKTRDDREVYIHTYHKPAYKRWWFVLMALGVIGYFGYFINSTYLEPNRLAEEKKLAHEQELQAFADEGILDYYLEHKSEVEYVFALMQKSENTLIELSKKDGASFMRIQSRRKLKDRLRDYRSIPPGSMDTYYVEGDLLMYSVPVREKIAERAWRLKIHTETITDVPVTFTNHIKLTSEELIPALKSVQTHPWEFERIKAGFQWSFYRFNRKYKVFVTNEPQLLSGINTNRLKQLSPGVYWYPPYY